MRFDKDAPTIKPIAYWNRNRMPPALALALVRARSDFLCYVPREVILSYPGDQRIVFESARRYRLLGQDLNDAGVAVPALGEPYPWTEYDINTGEERETMQADPLRYTVVEVWIDQGDDGHTYYVHIGYALMPPDADWEGVLVDTDTGAMRPYGLDLSECNLWGRD